MTKIENPYEKAQEFHRVFNPKKPSVPTAFSSEAASYRAGFKAEELVEFLFGTANNDEAVFQKLVEELKVSIDVAVKKVADKKEIVTDPLVDQVDALTDLLYFTYGSFSLLGVDPTEIFSIVHKANMGKVFPDGKPHYDPITNKVLKPADWQEKHAPEGKIKAEIERQSLQ
ncbi:pyrophosphohydrolase domain-containing protein [Enterococcus rivorum]|uniref:HAD family hydrolase n=1 Tax=Enterococcus rivorum TaxID=762845 RepID=A0A1E5KUT8_9ENTE|nr:HAD family hydrolase [Enterococcus rivorum]MBP2100519.1 putative HAD superfamily Cof-like phosphohydrolase [Enterococcus rivorum]OEH81643.1 HAD family hydrolase [Enterococcus rivorum]